jgi:hypothetical protein
VVFSAELKTLQHSVLSFVRLADISLLILGLSSGFGNQFLGLKSLELDYIDACFHSAIDQPFRNLYRPVVINAGFGYD